MLKTIMQGRGGMAWGAVSVVVSGALCVAAFLGSTSFALAAPATNPNQSTHPQINTNSCAAHLTREPDEVITMEPGKKFYIVTTSAAPANSTSPYGSVAQMPCKRRVIEVRVPSNTSSGCANCYPNAEIHTCAGDFANDKLFEEHCHVPKSSVGETTCKTFSHNVEVYKKPAGTSSFGTKALKTLRYKGFIDSSGCRVAATYLGQIHDTAESYANVTPPAAGMDVYRVLSLPRFDGSFVPTVLFIEYEEM